jgi:hypothetical protein
MTAPDYTSIFKTHVRVTGCSGDGMLCTISRVMKHLVSATGHTGAPDQLKGTMHMLEDWSLYQKHCHSRWPSNLHPP